MRMQYSEFIKKVKKCSGKRVHKLTNSYGVLDYYKYYKSTAKYGTLTYQQFSAVLKTMNSLIAEAVLDNNEFYLPNRMGSLLYYNSKRNVKMVDGKIITNRPVDWQKTLVLWHEDSEALNTKTLVRRNIDSINILTYDRRSAMYKNQDYYSMNFNRNLKRKVSELEENKYNSYNKKPWQRDTQA